ncbi:SGNH/GDSL hydrolase family protein [Chitinibacter fontanus]|uniref:SGNH/GDSL hydrolase family protein n=1 Tax=Chitinibacter fontanus TaxID=1737446 RepID=A0A7D5V8P0_9NEIS|nr:SGNH/GDSL hydrolase family protein [Chitinibacter fontanus]QLI80592.1 SGNH/GDSL hydrolase family protein [Chitinibacter fontanus]
MQTIKITSTCTAVSLALCASFLSGPIHAADSTSPPWLLSGRWQQSADRLQATWPGVTLTAQFKGSAVGVVLNDERSYYAVEIDGKAVEQIAPASGKRTIWLRKLAAGEHRIELIRRNETPDYVGTVYGLVLEDGQWLAAPAAASRKIEFIGDSFTAALANLSTKRDCNEREISSTTDISQGFAIQVARQLGAQWQTNAMSGMGLIRNWNGNLPDRDFRTFYARQLHTDSTSKPDARWQPQLVVIGLGINDFSTPVNAGEKRNTEQLATDFQAAYRQLIKELNSRYQQPQIIVTAMKLWPDDQQRPNVRAVVEAEHAAGNQRIHYLPLEPLQLTGCQWHPNLADHQQVAQQLLEQIQALKLNW